MFYGLLKPGEKWQDGLKAKDPNSTISVFDHVINGSSWLSKSKYISTCGNLKAVQTFWSKSVNPGIIVQISENNLPVEKIDLRTLSNRSDHYEVGSHSDELINKFNNMQTNFKRCC